MSNWIYFESNKPLPVPPSADVGNTKAVFHNRLDFALAYPHAEWDVNFHFLLAVASLESMTTVGRIVQVGWEVHLPTVAFTSSSGQPSVERDSEKGICKITNVTTAARTSSIMGLFIRWVALLFHATCNIY